MATLSIMRTATNEKKPEYQPIKGGTLEHIVHSSVSALKEIFKYHHLA